MTESREHFALDWLKREIDETLKSAREALEAYAEASRDEARMRACLAYIHQVHGTLLMLELTGVTLLSDEMEQLAHALLSRSVPNVENAQQLLMQGILQLPAVLEEIQKGVPDSRRAVLSLANELREARGAERLGGGGSKVAGLRAPTTDQALQRFQQIDGPDKVRRIRAAYQQVLLAILKGDRSQRPLDTLAKIGSGLERICEGTAHAGLWRAFSAFVASLAGQETPLTAEVVRLLRHVDAEIKTLAQSGAAALARPVSLELVKQLVDAARARGDRSPELERLADEIEQEPDAEHVAISKRDAIHTAAGALREELAIVKDGLDLFVRSDDRSAASLQQLSAPLKQIGSTLSILGFESSRAVINDQVEAIQAAVTRGSCDETLLLGVASALLQVDENLAAIAQRRGGGIVDSSGVVSGAQIAVLAETRSGLEQVKQAVVDYVSAQWDVNRLAEVPALMSAVKGALAMVSLARPAELLGRCTHYVANELIAGRVPDWKALDAFADAISGIDYYIERMCDDAAPPGQEILDLVERSLAELGYGEGSERALLAASATPIALHVEMTMPDTVPGDDAVEPAAAARTTPEPTGASAELPAEMADESPTPEWGATPPSEEFDLVIEDRDEVSSGAVSVDELADDAFDLSSSLFDTEAPAPASERVGAEHAAARSTVVEFPTNVEAPPPAELNDAALLAIDEPPRVEPIADVAALTVAEPADDIEELTAVAPGRVEEPTLIPAADEVEEPPLAAPEDDVEELMLTAPDDDAEELMLTAPDDDAEELTLTAPDADAEELMLTAPEDDAERPAPVAVEDEPAEIEAMQEPIASAPEAARQDAVLSFGRAATAEPRTMADAMDVDADILEIFVDEVAEVLQTIDQWLPQWAGDFGNEEAIAEVRRAFHTLKGSGRIVGATVIGELAWSIENMLNRAMDGTIEANDQIVTVARDGRLLVPALTTAFEARRPVNDGRVDRIMEKADILASGGRLEELVEEVEPAAASTTREVADAPRERTTTEESVQGARDDAETFALFEQEASIHLKVLEESFLRGETKLADAITDDVVRALHTLRGSASMADIEGVAGLAGPLYQVVREIRGRDVANDGEIFDFIQQGVFALRRTLEALGHGVEPHEDVALFEAESQRIVAQLGETPSPAASLLNLDGTQVLLGATDFLSAWRGGAMDLGALSDVVAALHELRNEAESRRQAPITELCDALIAAYERLEDQSLSAAAHGALSVAHEWLLSAFDAIASDQTLPDASAPIKALALARVAEVAEEADIDLTDLEEPLQRAANVVDFPLFVRPAQSSPSPAPMPVTRPNDAEVPVLDQRVEVAPSKSERAAARASAVLPSDADPEILEIFFEEADELLEAIDRSMHDWQGSQDDRVHLENLLRCLHTLKGGARLAGLSALGDAAHGFESFLIGVQGKPTLPAGFFEEAQVRHEQILASIAALRGEPADEPIGEPVDEAIDAAVAAANDIQLAQTAPQPEPRSRLAPAAEPEATTRADPAPRPPAVPTRNPAEAREMVRVSAGLLEQLVNLAGESSIIRSRVEQGMNDFSTSLEEMETTIERIREQLRRLEIETETQVLFREEVTQGVDRAEFDPLEMDRYSQLQQLSRALSESASDMLELKEALTFKARESETLLIQQARVNTELQEGLMRTRMVPFSRLLPRLRRTVRQVARDLDKEVELHVYNAEGELDRNVLERMIPPLEHMLRNSVDHGIERAEVRRGFGKPDAGRIDLRLSREAADVVLEISDDGAGIDIESVRAKAIERGLMVADARLRDDEILQFVLAPGFTTAKSVTQISGRGVGLDVLHSTVKQLGGSITIVSLPGKGTRFTVRLPFTVSVNRALMVSVGEDQYAIPLNTIEGIVRISGAELERLYRPDGGGFEYAGIPYRVRYLGSFIGRDYVALSDRSSVPVVLVRSGDRAVAVHVDGVQGSREIVVKSLGPQFAGVGGISGATILGDGSVVVILDLLALIRAQIAPAATNGMPKVAEHRPTCVLVVDDSVTVRRVTSRLLERQGMDVLLAKDGVEAIAMLQERRPDVVLLDIEMPRMDGFEVARQIRHDERLADLPIIIVSSRTGAKHQERAVEVGVNHFLGKPFQESELLATIERLVHLQ